METLYNDEHHIWVHCLFNKPKQVNCIATEYQGKLQKRWWYEKPFCRDLASFENCKYAVLEWSCMHPLSWLSISISLRAVEIIFPELETAYLLRETWKAFPAICPKHFTKAWRKGNFILENYVEGNLKVSAWSGSGGVCIRCAKHINKDFKFF